MPIKFSLREHKNYALYTPDYTFSKSAASVLRMASTDPALGDGFFFFVVNRAWLNGKYLRFNWRSAVLESTLTCYVYIYDGSYDRTSDVDFPSGSVILAKGNGLLQTVVSRSAAFGYETIDVQANVAAGSEDYCTIFVKLHDNQSGATGSVDLDWFEINSAAGGAGGLLEESFDGAITMERTGTSGDYGYISEDVYPVELGASFEVGQGSKDFPVKFEVGQGSVELGAGFIVRQPGSQDLAAGFEGQTAASLSAGFFLNRFNASAELPAGFTTSTIQISIREHKKSGFNPSWIFTKPSVSTLRGDSNNSSLGSSLWFFNVSREWIHGKYIRITWRGYSSYSSWSHRVYVYDGAYNPASYVDFPSGSSMITKGNGLLQTGLSHNGTFAETTEEFQVDVSGGVEGSVMILVISADSWVAFNGWIQVDTLEVNDSPGGVDMLYREPFNAPIDLVRSGTTDDYGFISEGELPLAGFEDLAAGFTVRQWREDLPAKFDSGQDSAILQAGFRVVIPASEDLAASFAIRQLASRDLAASIDIAWIGDLPAKFRVEKTFDLRGTAGIAFSWWGADNPPEALNQLILETPTGFWYSDFYDGPARLRYVFIPWGSFTWVSAEQRYLEPHHHGFDEPDKSQIDGFLITLHTTGVRRIDYIYAPLMAYFLGKFVVRRSNSLNLSAGFTVRHADSGDLSGELVIRRTATPLALPSGFLIRQGTLDLGAGFLINIEEEDLPAQFQAISLETEDFEDAVFVDHYQLDTGNGFRDSVWAHAGTYSWRTRQNQSDIFDISNGETLTYAKIVLWSRYGNGASNYLQLLGPTGNVLKTEFFGSTSNWTERTIEITAAVKYLKIYCAAGGNSGAWTDDVEIRWAT